MIILYGNDESEDIYMKLMVASDIHGSGLFCEKLIEAYKAEKPDKLVLLGDLLYHGPRNDIPGGYDTKKVASLLNGIKENILCVRGNCDSEVDQMVLDFPIRADYMLIYIGGKPVFATHGHLFGEDNPPKMADGFILLCGHTHVPACNDHGSFLYINPGSVSIPKWNSDRGYIVMTDDEITWKTLGGTPYRVEKLR